MSCKTNGSEDTDRVFLEHVLDRLYDFGSAPKRRSQKRNKPKRCEEEEEEERPARKDLSSDAEDYTTEHLQQQPETDATGGQHGFGQHFLIAPLNDGVNHVSPSGLTSRRVDDKVQVVTFHDPRKKQKTKQTPAANKMSAPQTTEKQQSGQPEELSLEKARLEVHRFGITGYKKEQQRVFEQERAVMLGARPLKKEYVNYRELQHRIKEKKEKRKEEVQPDLKKKKKQNQRDKKKKKVSSGSGSGSAPSGQMGRFKNGMLILSSKEIQKIKGK
ncbi:uncharacterized protein C1orf131-like isoform X1 [Parambassis ranga]|uniref:Uncharacterized protein C1orf131-like isoform X1 n=1 Tax=Parambassis ranga TaxID=210632 RepID=A0A6P7HJS4_9TELE|nr:uncharacterized protein C1orf131-like isoform X1 [Parambassis ranga]